MSSITIARLAEIAGSYQGNSEESDQTIIELLAHAGGEASGPANKLSAEAFCLIAKHNVDAAIDDEEFRRLVRRALEVTQYPRPERSGDD